MPSNDDKFDLPRRFDLGKTIGSIESSVSSIQHTVDKVNSKVDNLNDKINQLSHTTVKKTECADGCGKVEKKVDSVRTEIVGIRQDLSKKQTRREVPTLSLSDDTARYRVSSPHLPSILPADIAEDEATKKKSFLLRIRENVVAISAIIGLVTMAGVVFLKLARFVVRVETVLEKSQEATRIQTQRLKKEIKRIDEITPRVVYVPISPDAGTVADRPRSRRRRRPPARTIRSGRPRRPVAPAGSGSGP